MLNIVGAILIMMPALTIDASGTVDTVVVSAPRYEAEDAAWAGLMPAVTVTAPRYYSPAEMGMMDQVLVTAPRYAYEDVAWSGLMPEVLVATSKYTIPTAMASIWPSKIKFKYDWQNSVLVIEVSEQYVYTLQN